MELSIVILHHGNPNVASGTLRALSAAILPEQTEVFLVNNGEKGMNDVIDFDANGKFDLYPIEIANKGYPHGNNHALKMCKGKYLCILTDVEVERDTFPILLDYLNKNPHVGIAAPRLLYPRGVIQDNFRVFPRWYDLIIKRTVLRRFFKSRMRLYLMWDKDPYVSEAVDWLTGAMQVFRRECWEKIGPKDERYFLFMSDVDICRSAWECGFEVHFVGEAQAKHGESRLSGGSVADFFKKKAVRIHITDALKYFLKYSCKDLPEKAPSRNNH